MNVSYNLLYFFLLIIRAEQDINQKEHFQVNTIIMPTNYRWSLIKSKIKLIAILNYDLFSFAQMGCIILFKLQLNQQAWRQYSFIQINMLNQQKTNLKSEEKQKDPHFRKTSPKNVRHNSPLINGTKKFTSKLASSKKDQKQMQDKRLAFLKFIPSTSKNFSIQSDNVINNEAYNSIKQIKVPSFFRKTPQSCKNINEPTIDLENSSSSNARPANFLNKPIFFPINSEKENDYVLNQQQKSSDIETSLQNSNTLISDEQRQTELRQYKKLNDKINYLQSKIKGMKSILEQKRQQKMKFMQTQRTQRASVLQTDQQQSSTCSSSDNPLSKFVTQVPQHRQYRSFNKNPYSPRTSTYYITEIVRAYQQEKSIIREHLLSSMQYLKMFEYSKMSSQQQISQIKLNLPFKKGYQDKKTIIFDLDETLIHCNQSMNMKHDVKIKINFPTGQIIFVGINIRPYAKQILAQLSKKFQIIIFTASHSCYANVVLDYLDPNNQYIHHRLFRQHCICTPQGIYVKDLRIIGNRAPAKMVLVDNAAYSYAYQVLNGIPIIPYYEGDNDYQLYTLQKYIETLLFCSDVRERNKKTFKLNRYNEFNSVQSLVSTLYQKQSKGVKV